ncbi:hypothetical protein BJ875DRAFT_73224 [Amylocarpus encephaloides]|uniref:Uncharacterized protein n=1 Tax=Amylocarpus encephaloides TaxID=45428 RepID=A0A9P8C3Z0_9HELO|nr:hypothetical protein BJ875DRAFT_73224 [Amylocarpus encephaloides]
MRLMAARKSDAAQGLDEFPLRILFPWTPSTSLPCYLPCGKYAFGRTCHAINHEIVSTHVTNPSAHKWDIFSLFINYLLILNRLRQHFWNHRIVAKDEVRYSGTSTTLCHPRIGYTSLLLIIACVTVLTSYGSSISLLLSLFYFAVCSLTALVAMLHIQILIGPVSR